jgi:glucan phosphoethanolaminetransferase (alkaline phosphatase superfamily)
MKIFIAFVLIIIFLLIAAVHFYWAFGGKKWANAALPTTGEGNELLFKPRFFETAAVAVVFVGFAYIIACSVNLLNHSSFLIRYGSWFIPVVFLLRAVGEFRYVGFFKKITDTPFGQMDTKYYSPLCLGVAILSFIINYL